MGIPRVLCVWRSGAEAPAVNILGRKEGGCRHGEVFGRGWRVQWSGV